MDFGSNNSEIFRPPDLKIISLSDMLLGNVAEEENLPTSTDENDPISSQVLSISYTLFEDKYQILNNIGEGANGVVNQCKNKETGAIYAVKLMQLDQEYGKFLKKNYLSVRTLKHPNLITYKGLFLENDLRKCYLLMEYKDYPTLSDAKNINEEELQNITKQILQGLRYLHRKKFIHRDIKPDNILYDRKNGKIIIIDFGVGRKIMKTQNQTGIFSVTGSPKYRAPEVTNLGGYSEAVDLWSLGYSLYELVCGVGPFSSSHLKQISVAELAKGPGFKEKEWKKYSNQLKDLITNLLKVNPKSRLSAKEALNHLWFKPQIKKESEPRGCQSSKQENIPDPFSSLQVEKSGKKTETPKQLLSNVEFIDSDEEGVVEDGIRKSQK